MYQTPSLQDYQSEVSSNISMKVFRIFGILPRIKHLMAAICFFQRKVVYIKPLTMKFSSAEVRSIFTKLNFPTEILLSSQIVTLLERGYSWCLVEAFTENFASPEQMKVWQNFLNCQCQDEIYDLDHIIIPHCLCIKLFTG